MIKNKKILWIITIFLGFRVQADDSGNNLPVNVNANQNQVATDAEIIKALDLLLKAKVLSIKPDENKVKLHQGVFEKLKTDGKLDNAYSEMSTFCY